MKVAVDGREIEIFMLSPSFIGFVGLPAGKHQVQAEYRARSLKTPLLILGACTLAAVLASSRRFERL